MSKRLKRKIREYCGFDSLSKEDRAQRAKEIIDDTTEKQTICNDILGASFKDIEKVMKDVIDERRPSKQQEEYDELVSNYPEKVFPELQKQNARPSGTSTLTNLVPLLDPEEVAYLLRESSTSISESVVETPQQDYRTYSMEEVAALMECAYRPEMFKYRR